MPTYTFTNENTGEDEEHLISMSKLDEFKVDNPHLNQRLITAGFIGETTKTSGSLPEGFKDTLREMKKKHPHAKSLDKHI